jgi:hypothetical protein
VQLVVGVYVDDLIITGSDRDNIRSFKEEMAAAFKMSNLILLQNEQLQCRGSSEAESERYFA